MNDPRLRNNHHWYGRKARPTIYMALGDTPEPVYGGMLDHVGAGGLETTYVQLAEALARQFCTVVMLCRTERQHRHLGVYYVPWEQGDDMAAVVTPDYLITSRWFGALYSPVLAMTKKVVWLHDAHFADPDRPDAFDVADAVVCGSPWHRNYLAERFGETIKARKIRILPLTIDWNLLGDPVPKDPNLMLYSSNPDRGLESLLKMWPTILQRHPELRLVVTYGWEGLETWGRDDAWVQRTRAVRDQLVAMATAAGNVQFTGRLKKADLYSIINRAALCLYPNNFPETTCLTAIECQAAGTPLITTSQAALCSTVAQQHNVLIEADPRGQRYADRFIQSVDTVLNTPDLLPTMQQACRLWAVQRFPTWDQVARHWLTMLWNLTED